MPISHTYSEAVIRAINGRLPLLPGNRFGFTPLEINRNCGHGLVAPQSPLTPLNYDFYKDFSREYNFEYQNFEGWQQTFTPTSTSSCSSSSSKSESAIPGPSPTLPWSNSSSTEQSEYNYKLIFQIVKDVIAKTLPDNPVFKQQHYIDSLVKIHLDILARAYHQQVGCSPLTQLCRISEFFSHLVFKPEQNETVKHLYYDTAMQTWILKVHSTVGFVTIEQLSVDSNAQALPFNKITMTTFSYLGPFPVAINITTENDLQACIAKYTSLFADGFILKQIRIEAANPYLEIFNKLLFWNSMEHPDFLQYLAAPLTAYYTLKSPSSYLVSLSAAEKLCKLITEDDVELEFTGQDIIAMRNGQLKRYAEDLRPAIYFKAPQLFKALGYNFSNIPSFILQQEQFFIH